MATEVSKQPNGKVPLPESREMAVRQAATYYQEAAQEIEVLKREAAALRSEIAAHKVCVEAQSAQIIDLESRAATARAERDQAVTDMATYRAILISIQAQLRAFSIDHEPLVRQEDSHD